MQVNVRLFARLRELVGDSALPREVADGATVDSVWRSLAADYPSIAPYAASISCAVNADYAKRSTPVSDGDEVAFLPPVSGG